MWLDIHSTLTICLFYTRCLKEESKSESILWGSNQLCAVVLIFINVQLCPILHKTYSLNIGLKSRLPILFNTLKHSKYLIHVKHAYVLKKSHRLWFFHKTVIIKIVWKRINWRWMARFRILDQTSHSHVQFRKRHVIHVHWTGNGPDDAGVLKE